MNNFKIDFIGIGAMKSATSWINKCLAEHPDIYITPIKETHFFNRNFEKGLEFYKSFFTPKSPNLIIGEITPDYINKLYVAKRIYQTFPEIKLIACLRNPVDRAYSQYNFSKRSWPNINFEETIENYPDILEKGFYFKQLSEYLKYFKKEQIYVCIYEDIQKDPLKFIQGIYDFLGVRKDFKPQNLDKKINTGKWIIHFPKTRKFLHKISWGKKIISTLKFFKIDKLELFIRNQKIKRIKKKNIRPKEISLKTRENIYNIYQKDIKNLEKLIDRDLSHWK